MGDAPHGFELGPLEAEVLRLVWEMGDVQVDDVHRVLQSSREIAYTTVMTVMSRMAARGVLERRKAGRAYVYQAAVPREQMAGTTLREMVQRFWGGQVKPAVSYLLGQEKLSRQEIDELKDLLEKLSAEGPAGEEEEEP
jgi:BlaI family transcriptional regulator, penicillinase repressor